MSRGRQLVLRPLLAALLGLVAALAVMGAALLLLQVMPESDQPWGDLGQIFLGILLAGVAGVVVWVVGLVRAARHLFAPGRRLGVVIWSAFAILSVAVVLAIVGVVGFGLPILTAIIAALAGFAFSRTVS